MHLFFIIYKSRDIYQLLLSHLHKWFHKLSDYILHYNYVTKKFAQVPAHSKYVETSLVNFIIGDVHMRRQCGVFPWFIVHESALLYADVPLPRFTLTCT